MKNRHHLDQYVQRLLSIARDYQNVRESDYDDQKEAMYDLADDLEKLVQKMIEKADSI